MNPKGGRRESAARSFFGMVSQKPIYRDIAPGWVCDGRGVLRRATIHHMGRRLPEFDYSERCIYEITIVLEGRRPILGRLVNVAAAVSGRGQDGTDGVNGESGWVIKPSAWGEVVLECWRKIPDFWPQVRLIEAQLMPDHFHGILFVQEQLPLTRPMEAEGAGNRRKTLGDIIRGFKAGCTMGWRGVESSAPAAIAAGFPRWAEGFVDTILFRRGQLQKMIDYLRDNPRRLAVKHLHPELFQVSRDLLVPGIGRFSAIGNHFLLKWPELMQVQVSRADFAYRRERLPNGAWRIMRDAQGVPLVEKATAAFEEKAAELLDAARHGAVLVSPAISHGEREIARRAYVAGYRVIALQNKGFSPAYKPGGKLFDHCAAGNLLLLAPTAWPYVPGDRPPTRESSLVLNRIAQLLSGDGAAEINYQGAVMIGIDEAVRKALGN